MNQPEILLDVVDKWPSQEYTSEKYWVYFRENICFYYEVEPLVIGIDKMIDLERFISMDRLLSVTSYVLQFIKNVKSKVRKNVKLWTGYLTSEEFDNSKTLWLKYKQGLIMFDSNCNYEKLKRSLNLYEDENNIWFFVYIKFLLKKKSRFNRKLSVIYWFGYF